MTSRKVLVTGGCGFIGSCFIRLLHQRDPTAQVVNLDLLTYAGNPENLASLEGSPRYAWVRDDVRNEEAVERLVEGIDWLVHFAAESHVDRSTASKAGAFVDTNVYGTFVLLDAMRRLSPGARFLQIGTDEVYGDVAAPGMPHEGSLLSPSSPYSASKAGADHVALAFARTHDLDVMVSRCTNNYGPYQYPEKLIPRFIEQLKNDKKVTIQGKGDAVRAFLHAYDTARAFECILEKGTTGEIYNIGCDEGMEYSVMEVARILIKLIKNTDDVDKWITYIEDRPFNDQRYYISNEKVKKLGWSITIDFMDGLEKLI